MSSSMLEELSGADTVLEVLPVRFSATDTELELLPEEFSGADIVADGVVTLLTQSEKRSTGSSRAGQRLVFLMASCLMQLARIAELEVVRWIPSLKQLGVKGLGRSEGKLITSVLGSLRAGWSRRYLPSRM